MIDTSRFKGDNRIRKFFNNIFEIGKSFKIHREFVMFNRFKVMINNGKIKEIFRDVNTDKIIKFFVLVFIHFVNLLNNLLKLIPQSYLLVNSGLKAKSTNGDLGDRGQTPFEALKLRKNEVFCPQILKLKSNINELNFCKYIISNNLYHKKT